jgi:CRP/FNR family transcriptional regulator, dissimilatory nitrate respiration regulator
MKPMERESSLSMSNTGDATCLDDRLRDFPLFEGLSRATIGRIAAAVKGVTAPCGTVIFKRGDACRGCYIVLSGRVKLVLEAEQGADHIVELVGPGGTLGETPLFLDVPHLLTAETLADTRLAYMPKAMVLAELKRTPEFTRGIIANLSRRQRHLIEALENCTLRSGTERVIGYLLDRLPTGDARGQATVTLKEKKGLIASQLNLTHEHFSRILRGLARAAMVEVDGRNVHIRDVGQLRAYCLES